MHKYPKNDCTCFYRKKRVGRCTISDGEAYNLLMKACEEDASRVLKEYKYFSPELKNILEKVVGLQAYGKIHPRKRNCLKI